MFSLTIGTFFSFGVILLVKIVILFIFIFNYNSNFCSAQRLNITVGSCVIQYSEVCSSNYVKFYISTSDHPERESFLLDFDNKNLTFPSWISLGNDFKLIIHGYGGGIEYNDTKDLRNEYLKRKGTNIIIVDWGRLSTLPCYPTAAVNTKQAGECIKKFLLKLSKTNPSFNPVNIHMIGFSLGAHVAGFASNSLRRVLGKSIERITGLDPALPLFATANRNRKLDASDAEFVDVIHTNSGIFGKIEPSGHVDFYVNGGQIQPQCNRTKNIPRCSHMMATVYFKESITTDVGFWGIQCSSYFQYIFGWCGSNTPQNFLDSNLILMGEKCPKTSRGIIFVYTNFEPPFAMGNITIFQRKFSNRKMNKLHGNYTFFL